jgi:hypothetical protein
LIDIETNEPRPDSTIDENGGAGYGKAIKVCGQHFHTVDCLEELVKLGVSRERDVSWLMKQFRWFLGTSGVVLMFLGGAYLTASYQYKLEIRDRDAIRMVLIGNISDLAKVSASHDIKIDKMDKMLSELQAYTQTQNSRDAIRAFQSSRIDMVEKQVQGLSDIISHLHPATKGTRP